LLKLPLKILVLSDGTFLDDFFNMNSNPVQMSQTYVIDYFQFTS